MALNDLQIAHPRICKHCARTHDHLAASPPPPPWVHGGGKAVVGTTADVFTNPWVRNLKIGSRAKKELADDKGDVRCIT